MHNKSRVYKTKRRPPYLPVSSRTGIVLPPSVMLEMYSALWVLRMGIDTSETGIVLLFSSSAWKAREERVDEEKRFVRTTKGNEVACDEELNPKTKASKETGSRDLIRRQEKSDRIKRTESLRQRQLVDDGEEPEEKARRVARWAKIQWEDRSSARAAKHYSPRHPCRPWLVASLW